MRIALGQLWQETNTFNPLPTTRAEFEQFGVLTGQAVIERMAETNELGGFIQTLRSWPEQPELIGLARLPAWPSGVATAETVDWLCQSMLTQLQAALPVDAVLLALHGAMVGQQTPDVEGRLLAQVRHLVGNRVPVVATLDLHANVTRQMVEMAEALVLYHTAPHVDVFETGQRGARLLERIVRGGARPVRAYCKLPLVLPADRANTQDPSSPSYALRQLLVELEQRPEILTAGLATVQPWLDIPELGSAVVVVSDGDPHLARSQCLRLATELWTRRFDYLPTLVPAEEAVRQAAEVRDGLVVLSDSADATTSGAPGDSTWLLSQLVRYDWPRQALVTLVAPEVVVQAAQAGTGAELTLSLGGRRDARFSRPLTLPVRVGRFFAARFVMSGHLARNLAIDMGPAVVLEHGSVRIVVTSRSGPHFAPELFRCADIDPFAVSVLVAKSPCGFRASYAPVARLILQVQAPGCAPSDFWNYDYRQIPRPLWPWDQPGWDARTPECEVWDAPH